MTLQGVKQRFGIIGRSEVLDRALSTAIRVSNTDLSVLIQGESGVGKEVFSKIIHELSKRKHNKFIAINCGAIPEGTINSELFGHERGAFTGASSDRSGYFETVDGGTIFLDEIGEMPLDTQAYLLRVLESGEFIKVGSSKTIKTDVRVIAATNAGLTEQIRKGKFREDLYYRLNTVPIKVPALHERREDIYMLFRKFAIDFAEKYRSESVALDERAQLVIENYRWPGNVRELKNLVEQLSVLADQALIDAEALLNIAPHLLKRNLPSIPDRSSESDSGFQERELLFKFLLEMKTDLNDLKSLVYELINTNDLNVPDMQRLAKGGGSLDQYMRQENDAPVQPNINKPFYTEEIENSNRPIILSSENRSDYDQTEVVEENLSLEAMEKDMIGKALKKHRGRRKDAAEELGISERTLYRKIKQYEIDE
ncbi:MAG: sigma-54 dependent transcriptional regulator [Saprospiraceae bacterium]|nr:sigma-54 dependent transcriptional regulator [Saprospiraceae bacterium]